MGAGGGMRLEEPKDRDERSLREKPICYKQIAVSEQSLVKSQKTAMNALSRNPICDLQIAGWKRKASEET